MKQGIKERTELIRNLVDAYTRSVEEFCKHEFLDDYGNSTIDRNSGATRNQLHEQSKLIRREVLKLDKDIQRQHETEEDEMGLGR